MVTFQKLAVVNEFALLALLPGIATLAFLACAISWMISYMTFAQWHAVFPEHRWRKRVACRREQPVPVQADADGRSLPAVHVGNHFARRHERGSCFRLIGPGTRNEHSSLLTLWRRHHSRSGPLRDAHAGRSSEDSGDRGLRDGVDRDSRVGCCPLTMSSVRTEELFESR